MCFATGKLNFSRWPVCVSFVFQIFNGNSGREDVVKHSLVGFTRARFVKFQPTEFNNYKALRVEIYGVPVLAGRVSRIAILY